MIVPIRTSYFDSFPSSLHPSYLQPSTHLCSPTCPNQESDKPCIPWHQTVCSPTFHSYPPCLSLPCFPFLGFHWLLDLNSIPTNLLLNLYLSLDSTPGLTVIKSRARARSLYDVTANFSSSHPISWRLEQASPDSLLTFSPPSHLSFNLPVSLTSPISRNLFDVTFNDII